MRTGNGASRTAFRTRHDRDDDHGRTRHCRISDRSQLRMIWSRAQVVRKITIPMRRRTPAVGWTNVGYPRLAPICGPFWVTPVGSCFSCERTARCGRSHDDLSSAAMPKRAGISCSSCPLCQHRVTRTQSPTPPTVRCSTRARWRTKSRDSNRLWMKVQWHVSFVLARPELAALARSCCQ
jgi:hypothetical protein